MMTAKDAAGQRHRGRHGRGPSSFWMHEPEKVFAELHLKPGDRFLDLGCGPGDYSLYASKLVGGSGLVYALDRGDDAIAAVSQKMATQKCSDIRVIQTDITDPLPLGDDCVDLCLLATVLHIIRVKPIPHTLFTEVHRVLRPGGRLAVIECKKEDQPFGPPKHIRLSPREVEEALGGKGLQKTGLVDLGFNYLLQFMAP